MSSICILQPLSARVKKFVGFVAVFVGLELKEKDRQPAFTCYQSFPVGTRPSRYFRLIG